MYNNSIFRKLQECILNKTNKFFSHKIIIKIAGREKVFENEEYTLDYGYKYVLVFIFTY